MYQIIIRLLPHRAQPLCIAPRRHEILKKNHVKKGGLIHNQTHYTVLRLLFLDTKTNLYMILLFRYLYVYQKFKIRRSFRPVRLFQPVLYYYSVRR